MYNWENERNNVVSIAISLVPCRSLKLGAWLLCFSSTPTYWETRGNMAVSSLLEHKPFCLPPMSLIGKHGCLLRAEPCEIFILVTLAPRKVLPEKGFMVKWHWEALSNLPVWGHLSAYKKSKEVVLLIRSPHQGPVVPILSLLSALTLFSGQLHRRGNPIKLLGGADAVALDNWKSGVVRRGQQHQLAPSRDSGVEGALSSWIPK